MRITVIKNRDKYLQILICFIIGFSTINSGALTFLRSILVLPMKLDVAFTYFMYFVVILLSIKIIFKRITHDTILLLFVLTIAYLISLLIQVQEYSLLIGIQLFICSMVYIAARALRKYDYLIKFMNYTSILITISVIIIYLLFPSKEVIEQSYSQNLGYAILPAVIISFNAFLKKKSLLHLINFVVAFVLLTMAGARGPFVITILFILISSFQVRKSFSKKKKFLSVFFGVLFIIIFTLVFWPKVEKLVIINSFNDSNRIIQRLEQDNMFEDDSRNTLITNSLSLIIEHPFGMGIGQERAALSDNYQDDVGWYPHNLFLEVLLHYGIIIGVIIIVFLIYLMYISFIKNKNDITRNIWLMLFSIGFMPLMFSGSYTNWPLFWLFLGLSVNIFYENRLVRKD